ncbi:MAG: hypothetical protein EBX50_01690 [Chitinophagia bacterium]|nr:hypothetical protein [Chitinophagia bacterium]
MSTAPSISSIHYPDYFRGKHLHIVSQHRKQESFEPALSGRLGFECETVTEVDTDLLGTFSGEVERTLAPLECAREKCRQALSYCSDGYLLASEGSFGAHPTLGWVATGEEWVVFYDIKEQFEVVVRNATLDTCFFGEHITSEQQCLQFLQKVGFPKQGIILKYTREHPQHILKNLHTEQEVVDKVAEWLASGAVPYIETDMRAMYNPTRQRHLIQMGHLLADTLSRICNACGWYGFSVTSVERGLPCGCCGNATESVLAEIYTCKKCAHSERKRFPRGIEQENPQFCNYCNP